MKVRLLEDIWEHDRNGGRAGLKVSVHRGRAVAFTKGAVIECSDATGQKFIDRKQAEEVNRPSLSAAE